MEIRVQRISEKNSKIYKAIARVKFGVKPPVLVKTLLSELAGRYSKEEMERIMSLYETLESED